MASLCVLFLSFCALAFAALPVVDLGYERHQAALLNVRIVHVLEFDDRLPDIPTVHRRLLQFLQYSLCPASNW